MKNRTDKVLLAVFVVTLPLHIFLVLTYLEIIPIVETWTWPYRAQELYAYLAFGFFAVPVFCLQLLLCRRKRCRVAAIPALVIVGVVLLFTYGFFTATGWDALGWGVLLLLCIAPAAGCVLFWAVYGLWRLCQKGDICENRS